MVIPASLGAGQNALLSIRWRSKEYSRSRRELGCGLASPRRCRAIIDRRDRNRERHTTLLSAGCRGGRMCNKKRSGRNLARHSRLDFRRIASSDLRFFHFPAALHYYVQFIYFSLSRNATRTTPALAMNTWLLHRMFPNIDFVPILTMPYYLLSFHVIIKMCLIYDY